MYDNPFTQQAKKEICILGLESEVKRAKTQHATFASFNQALMDFAQSSCFYWIDGHEDKKFYFALLGVLNIQTLHSQQRYTSLLAQLEREKLKPRED